MMNALVSTGDHERRSRVLRGLVRRNRTVDVLRLLVPAAGIAVLGGVVLKLYLATLGENFGFSSVRFDRNNLVVETPSYSSIGADGSHYRVDAAEARTALGDSDVIALVDAVLTISKPSGLWMTAAAEAANFSTSSQVVIVQGVARIANSEGTQGTLADVRADMAAESMEGSGAVDISFANGARLRAMGMSYDGRSSTWRFGQATLELPGTPGESTVPAAADGREPPPEAPVSPQPGAPMPRAPLPRVAP